MTHKLTPKARTRLARLADTHLDAGESADETIRRIVAAIDTAVDFVAIGSAVGPIGAAVGAGLELVDGPFVTAIVTGIVRRAERRKARAA